MTRLTRLRRQGISWEQFGFQLAIVLLGVFLALVTGRIATKYEERQQAKELLKYVASELRQDASEIRELIEIQKTTSDRLAPLMEAIRHGASDSIIGTNESALTLSGVRTLFARRAAYTMMINRGLLASVGDKKLQVDLADLYDHDYRRVETLNEMSDEVWVRYSDAMREFWDPLSGRKIPMPFARERALSSLNGANQWSQFYRRNMRDTLKKVEAVATHIESYVE